MTEDDADKDNGGRERSPVERWNGLGWQKTGSWLVNEQRALLPDIDSGQLTHRTNEGN